MIEHHAAIARTLAEQLGAAEAVLDALGAAYERWDGRAGRAISSGEEVPLAVADRAASPSSSRSRTASAASRPRRQLARERRGGQFDPALCRPASMREGEVILSGLDDVGTWDAVIAAEPALAVVLSGERVDAALLAIAELRRPQVALLPRPRARGGATSPPRPATRLGLADAESALLRRAGLVHDLGRLGISNAIWDKRGPLGAGRVGAGPAAAVHHRAHAAPVRGARAAGGDRRPAPRAARRLGLSARALRRRDLARRRACSPPPTPTRRCASRARTGRRARADEAAAELRADVKAGRLDAEAVEAVLGAAGHRVPRRREGPAGLTAARGRGAQAASRAACRTRRSPSGS